MSTGRSYAAAIEPERWSRPPTVSRHRGGTQAASAWRRSPISISGGPQHGGRAHQRVVDATNALRPDLVVLLGDYVAIISCRDRAAIHWPGPRPADARLSRGGANATLTFDVRRCAARSSTGRALRPWPRKSRADPAASRPSGIALGHQLMMGDVSPSRTTRSGRSALVASTTRADVLGRHVGAAGMEIGDRRHAEAACVHHPVA